MGGGGGLCFFHQGPANNSRASSRPFDALEIGGGVFSGGSRPGFFFFLILFHLSGVPKRKKSPMGTLFFSLLPLQSIQSS